jgi:mRNA interferase HigB
VLSKRPLERFWTRHPDAKVPLKYWLQATKSATWKNFSDVRRTFGSADVYKALTIFNIGGNNYRLIVEINYKTQIVYVHEVLTHSEYDKGDWKDR